MDKTYNPKQIEETWYKIWESRGYFKPDRPDLTNTAGSR